MAGVCCKGFGLGNLLLLHYNEMCSVTCRVMSLAVVCILLYTIVGNLSIVTGAQQVYSVRQVTTLCCCYQLCVVSSTSRELSLVCGK